MSNLDFYLSRVSAGEDITSVLASLVEDGELVKAPGRRDVLKQVGGAIVGSPLTRGLAPTIAAQVVTQAVSHALAPPKPSFASHVDHPKAGTGVVIPRHEVVAGAHNLFRKEHGSDLRVTPGEVAEFPLHNRPGPTAEFDWKGHTGHDPHQLVKDWRGNPGVTRMELHGFSKTKHTPEQYAASHSHADILAHQGYRKQDDQWGYSADDYVKGPNVEYWHEPNASHSVMSIDRNTGEWSHVRMTYGEFDRKDWTTVKGRGNHELLTHLHSLKTAEPLTHVNTFKKGDETYHEFVNTAQPSWSEPNRRTASSWSYTKPDHKGRVVPGKLSYGEAPHHDFETQKVENAWDVAKKGPWSDHYEKHGDVLSFSAERREDPFKGVITDPEHPDYHHGKFMDAYQKMHTGHFVIENPMHWNNLKPGESSPLDKKHFDAMHVDPHGKVTRFRVPFDPTSRDLDFGSPEEGLHYRSAEHLDKLTKARFKSIQGTQWKHFDLAHKSAGLSSPAFSFSHPEYSRFTSDSGEVPITSMTSPSVGHNELPKGVLRTTVHPDGRWELHTGSAHGTTSPGEISNWRSHSTGEGPADLRKNLMAAKKELS